MTPEPMNHWTAASDRSLPESPAAPAGNPILRDLLWCVIAGAVGVGIVLALLPAAGHDQLWCLYVAGRMLDGVRLYGPEIFESNPPLIMWVSEVPVALARVLHVESSFTAKLLTLVVLAAIYFTVVHCLRRTCRNERPTGKATWIPALTSLFFAVAFLCVPARDFGQREHLLSFLVLPYLVLAAAPQRYSPRLRFLAGGVAALGICLKPQQALLPLAVELLVIAQTRSLRSLRRPEPWLLLGVSALYVGAIRLFTPTYLTDTLPVLRQTYWAIGHLDLQQLLQESWQLQLLGCAAALLMGLRAARSRLTSAGYGMACVLLAAGAGADLAYLQQGTGWYYQQLPAIACFLGCNITLLADAFGNKLATSWWPPAWTRAAAATLAVMATALTLHFSGYPISRDRAFAIASPDPSLFCRLPPGTPVAILTTSVDEAMMPIARYHLFWAQRTNNLWWMPAILRSEAPHLPGTKSIAPLRLAELASLQRRNVAEDLDRWRPTLVLVERCQYLAVRCQVIEDLSPDLLAWFRQGASFRVAFTPYRFLRTDGRFDVYRRQSAGL